MIASDQLKKLCDGLADALMRSEQTRLRKRELQLIDENAKLSGNKFSGFHFNGHTFTVDGVVIGKTLGLEPSLVPQVDLHAREAAQFAFDKVQIRQILSVVLSDCRNNQDFRDTLPDSLALRINEIKNLPRTRSEAFTIMGNPQKMRQYKKLKDKIAFYSALNYIN